MKPIYKIAIPILAFSILGFSLSYLNGCASQTSAFPITLSTIDQLNDGKISFEETKPGEIFVTAIDRFGDGHIHVLNYTGVSKAKALEIVAAKQRQLEEPHWAIMGGHWLLETNLVPKIISDSRVHLQTLLAEAAVDLDRTNIQSILSRWNSYSCQLLPVLDKDGKKIVSLRFFPTRREREFKTWRTKRIQVEGGGCDYWGVEFDADQKEYSGFVVNAVK